MISSSSPEERSGRRVRFAHVQTVRSPYCSSCPLGPNESQRPFQFLGFERAPSLFSYCCFIGISRHGLQTTAMYSTLYLTRYGQRMYIHPVKRMSLSPFPKGQDINQSSNLAKGAHLNPKPVRAINCESRKMQHRQGKCWGSHSTANKRTVRNREKQPSNKPILPNLLFPAHIAISLSLSFSFSTPASTNSD